MDYGRIKMNHMVHAPLSYFTFVTCWNKWVNVNIRNCKPQNKVLMIIPRSYNCKKVLVHILSNHKKD